MELDVRLNILKEAGQISEDTFNILKKVILMIRDKWNIQLTEENGAMLITHLSVALERIKKGEIIEGIDSEIYEQIKSHPMYKKCTEVLKNIEEESNIKIPENEQTFIMMHLCTLFETNK